MTDVYDSAAKYREELLALDAKAARRMADAGFAVTHLYGLTETYGPAVVNEWHGSPRT